MLPFMTFVSKYLQKCTNFYLLLLRNLSQHCAHSKNTTSFNVSSTLFSTPFVLFPCTPFGTKSYVCACACKCMHGSIHVCNCECVQACDLSRFHCLNCLFSSVLSRLLLPVYHCTSTVTTVHINYYIKNWRRRKRKLNWAKSEQNVNC